MKIYKKYFFTAILILSISVISTAQRHQQCQHHREAIKAERVAYITDALSLTVKEAQVFWPIFNDYNKKIEELRDKKYAEMKDMRTKSIQLSEAEYQSFLDKYIYFIEKETVLKKKYQKDLSKILSAKKIYLLYKTEKDFKRKLVKDLRGRKPACLE